jgi:ribosomal protein L15E
LAWIADPSAQSPNHLTNRILEDMRHASTTSDPHLHTVEVVMRDGRKALTERRKSKRGGRRGTDPARRDVDALRQQWDERQAAAKPSNQISDQDVAAPASQKRSPE